MQIKGSKYKTDRIILISLIILTGCALNKKDLTSYEYYCGSETFDKEWEPIYGYFKAFNFTKDSNRWQMVAFKGLYRDQTVFYAKNGTKRIKDTLRSALNDIDTFRCKFYKRNDTIFMHARHGFSRWDHILERKFYVESKNDTVNTSDIFPKFNDGGKLIVNLGKVKIRIKNKIFECDKIKVWDFPPAAILYSTKNSDTLIKERNKPYKIYYFDINTHIPIVIQNCYSLQHIEAFVYPKILMRPKVSKIAGCNCD